MKKEIACVEKGTSMLDVIKRQFVQITQQNSNSLQAKFVKFFVLGGFVSLIDFLIYTILNYTIFQQNHLVSNTISFSVGVILSYYLSRKWIFNYQYNDFIRVFTLFIVTSLIGLFISDYIIFVLVDQDLLKSCLGEIRLYLSDKKLLSSLAKIISMFVVLIWNFYTKNMIVFKNRRG